MFPNPTFTKNYRLRDRVINWGIFLALCLIWGSSFILMKAGMEVLSPYQVASIRILSAGLILTPFALRALRAIPRNKWLLVLLSGLLGNFFPAYLFCIAETQIDSSLAGILNALTPLFTIMVGTMFFQLKTRRTQIIGVLIGLIGLCLLTLSGKDVSFKNLSYTSLVLLATLFYGINVNMVSQYMRDLGSLNIASLAFCFLIIPSAIFLYATGYFQQQAWDAAFWKATMASCILGVFGTAVASIIFYMLVKRAGTLFASTVTYGIPFVAVGWGLLYNESITLLQVGCLGIILAGVYLINKR